MASECDHKNSYPSEWHCEDCEEWFSDANPAPKKPTPEQARFRRWWKETPGFDQCTLTQAVGAYVSTFPGRILPLLRELLASPDDPVEHVAPPKSRKFLSE